MPCLSPFAVVIVACDGACLLDVLSLCGVYVLIPLFLLNSSCVYAYCIVSTSGTFCSSALHTFGWKPFAISVTSLSLRKGALSTPPDLKFGVIHVGKSSVQRKKK